MDEKQQLIRSLLQIAVELKPQQPFKFSSGILSPIYCDNRRLVSHPDVRDQIITSFIEHIASLETIDIVAGTATAGIAWAAILADRLQKPMLYVRKSAKGHGHGQQIEGEFSEGDKVLLIEDLISTGSSAINAIEALRGAKLEVIECLSIVSYDLSSAITAFDGQNINKHSLVNLTNIISFAESEGLLTHEQRELIASWQSNPKDWAKACEAL